MSTSAAANAPQAPEITTTSPAGHTTPVQREVNAQPTATTTAPTKAQPEGGWAAEGDQGGA